MKQIPLPLAPDLQASFDTFIDIGNAAVLAHMKALAGLQAPVYLWGDTGAGKTHLLLAAVGRAQSAGAQVGWFSARAPLPWSVSPSWSVVVIDDCHLLDSAEQHEAFSVFVEAASHGIQVLAAGQAPPIDLPLREDLRTRLAWGHVFAVVCLPEEQTRASLRREADRRGIFLTDEVMDYLLTRFSRDLKHLMRLLDELDDFSMVAAKPVTVQLLRKMLAGSATPSHSPELST